MTTNIRAATSTSPGVIDPALGDGVLNFYSGNNPASQVLALSLDAAGKMSLNGQTVSASVTNTVTNKLALTINGTTYYLLASTSGA